MSKILHTVKRQPVALLTVLAVVVQGVLEVAQENNVATWGQLWTALLGAFVWPLVTPVAAPNLPSGD